MIEQKFYLTKEGLEKIKKEYQELRDLRISVVKAGAPKTLQSEDPNPEYLSFQEDLDLFETKIAQLDYVLKNVEIIKSPSRNDQGVVHLGATVTLQENNGQTNEFMLVGTLEADPEEGKISLDSPIGKAIFGKRTGEEVFIDSPAKIAYNIKKIKYQI